MSTTSKQAQDTLELAQKNLNEVAYSLESLWNESSWMMPDARDRMAGYLRAALGGIAEAHVNITCTRGIVESGGRLV